MLVSVCCQRPTDQTGTTSDYHFLRCHRRFQRFLFDEIFTFNVGCSAPGKIEIVRNMLFRKDPRKKLTRAYQQKMEAAMHAMRNGDVKRNAFLTREAEAIKAELDQLHSTD